MKTDEKVSYTPGPWHVEPEKLQDGQYHVAGRAPIIYANGSPIATLARLSMKAHDRTAEANARLIAAAPEMAKALREAVEYLRQYGAGATLDNALAALKKAGL